ncbi:hypothetical protein VTK73DRAFT_7396 [Phialemonium thermophilum]|uniref:Uncharacterized protein n=1 Tax=Phialemonium thermophilum TaxID=223376 RepID=A0ABR3XSU3_9PEZI
MASSSPQRPKRDRRKPPFRFSQKQKQDEPPPELSVEKRTPKKSGGKPASGSSPVLPNEQAEDLSRKELLLKEPSPLPVSEDCSMPATRLRRRAPAKPAGGTSNGTTSPVSPSSIESSPSTTAPPRTRTTRTGAAAAAAAAASAASRSRKVNDPYAGEPSTIPEGVFRASCAYVLTWAESSLAADGADAASKLVDPVFGSFTAPHGSLSERELEMALEKRRSAWRQQEQQEWRPAVKVRRRRRREHPLSSLTDGTVDVMTGLPQTTTVELDGRIFDFETELRFESMDEMAQWKERWRVRKVT